MEDFLMDHAGYILVPFMALCIALISFVFVFGVLQFSGSYHYDYRCTDGVVESRQVFNGVGPLGGFDPIDGDPVGACK